MMNWQRMRRLPLVVIILLVTPRVGFGEIVTFEATLSQAWDPTFVAFPVEGTGSSATGTLHFVYDTNTKTALDLDLDVQRWASLPSSEIT